MSANVQEPKAARKRTHEEFSGDDGAEDAPMDKKPPSDFTLRPSGDCLLPPVSNTMTGSSPQGSPALTEAGSSTAAGNSPAPETPTKAGTTQPVATIAAAAAAAQTSTPAGKRKKLTPAEKEAREKEATEKREQKEREAAQKKKERDDKAAIKAADKAKQEEEKAVRQKERDEKRKKKEEEEKLKAEQREEKKKQKEDEERRIQEEKEKKARAQPKLMHFFSKPTTPKKSTPAIVPNSSSEKGTADAPNGKPTPTVYELMFQPFFIKENTRMAPSTCNMDEETRELKSRILDEFIAGERKADVTFDPASLFPLPAPSKRRGKQHIPVRHIMEAAYKEVERSGTTASADILHAAGRKLAGVPVKVIAFSRDVRPPYYGTITQRPFPAGQDNMQKQARRSASRRLQLDYDYDSEAEWQEEEGEDLDADDDDEEMDDEDDMDGFLDDSEDSGLTRRTFGNTMEPEMTGICFENENRRTSSQAATEHKMEIILDIFHNTASIDPFATSYWEPEPKPVSLAKVTPTTATTAQKMPPPPAPANAFAALTGGSTDGAPAKLVKAELMNDIKRAILQNKALSKVGIIDFIFHNFRDKVSRTEVKNTLELVAEKKGTGKMKEWDLKPGHEISL
ncbi:hypothetical protein V2A60_007365 [Cordyceps javanica]|uniref:Chromatin assembly factor 1 subunit A n=1 Tax=Cordyceps javanica TaxID=43265 RepID=A0A545W823_9HYPO|nr:chromatin assembly factor 1 subunit A [Cordyceps javanica]TQW10147.1 chromatin assembly factor 1 subunit A [Cordyceps javanica]